MIRIGRLLIVIYSDIHPHEKGFTVNADMIRVGSALPHGSFGSLYIRELSDGRFALVAQQLRFAGDDHTLSEEVIATGTIIEIMRVRVQRPDAPIDGAFISEPPRK